MHGSPPGAAERSWHVGFDTVEPDRRFGTSLSPASTTSSPDKHEKSAQL